jgi:hypothetical protein
MAKWNTLAHECESGAHSANDPTSCSGLDLIRIISRTRLARQLTKNTRGMLDKRKLSSMTDSLPLRYSNVALSNMKTGPCGIRKSCVFSLGPVAPALYFVEISTLKSDSVRDSCCSCRDLDSDRVDVPWGQALQCRGKPVGFILVVHRRCRPAADETVPHPSSVFCSMGGIAHPHRLFFVLLNLHFCFFSGDFPTTEIPGSMSGLPNTHPETSQLLFRARSPWKG